MTKRKSITSLAIAVSLLAIVSCSNASKPSANQDHSQHTDAMMEADEMEMQAIQLSKEQVQKVLSDYLELKNALVQTDGESASLAAKKLLEGLGDNQDKLIIAIRMDAEHITGTQAASHQRDHFNTLSDNVYTLVKSTSANENTIYRQFCPMALDNKGAYWLSAEEEINNPYFGDKMLKCGAVKEQIL